MPRVCQIIYMGLFDFFKKKINEIPKDLKVPLPKYLKIELERGEIKKIRDQANDIYEVLRSKHETKEMSQVGKIFGYHPYPKDIVEQFYAVVNWPVHKKAEKSFVVDMSYLVRSDPKEFLSDTYHYPAEGTWITFYPLGTSKDVDNISRTYCVAEAVAWDIFPNDMKIVK